MKLRKIRQVLIYDSEVITVDVPYYDGPYTKDDELISNATLTKKVDTLIDFLSNTGRE